MATIYDVAKLAEVSTTTVSKVLSNTPYVSAKTREKILAAMAELKYSPSLAARGLTGNRTYILGLVVPYDPDYLFGDPFLLEVIRGVESCANNNDYNLLLSLARKDNQRSAYARLQRSRYLDGVIFLETLQSGVEVHYFEEQNVPCAFIGYGKNLESGNCVHADDYRGAFEAVTHLLELGHRRIGIVSGPSNFMYAVNERWRGTNSALAAYNLDLDDCLVGYGDFTLESGYQIATQLLAAETRPTAIFAQNDRMAVGVMRRARELGLNIPGDLSLVGFDDVPLSQLAEPALTTVRQPGYELGVTAAQKLIELIAWGNLKFEPVVLPVEFIPRNSTAPLKP
jgi:DNA-binding LacI/PurR family transcriptional regulator